MDQVEVVKRIELGNKSAFSKDMSARTVSPELTTPSSQSEYEEPGQRSKQIKPSKKHQKPLDPEQPPAPKRVKRKRKLRRNSDSDFEAEVARPTKRKPTGVLTPDSAEAGPEAANSKDHTVIRHSQCRSWTGKANCSFHTFDDFIGKPTASAQEEAQGGRQ